MTSKRMDVFANNKIIIGVYKDTKFPKVSKTML